MRVVLIASSKSTSRLDWRNCRVASRSSWAGKLMVSLDDLVSDKKVRQDVQESLANIRSASESATHIAAKLEKFSGDFQNLTVEAMVTVQKAQQAIEKT